MAWRRRGVAGCVASRGVAFGVVAWHRGRCVGRVLACVVCVASSSRARRVRVRVLVSGAFVVSRVALVAAGTSRWRGMASSSFVVASWPWRRRVASRGGLGQRRALVWRWLVVARRRSSSGVVVAWRGVAWSSSSCVGVASSSHCQRWSAWRRVASRLAWRRRVVASRGVVDVALVA
ncbi:hypothetical protein ACXZ9C_11505 [Streptococcus agalactiae]